MGQKTRKSMSLVRLKEVCFTPFTIEPRGLAPRETRFRGATFRAGQARTAK